jgi:hypothetical protein
MTDKNTTVTEFVESEMEEAFTIMADPRPEAIVDDPFVLQGFKPGRRETKIGMKTNRGTIHGIERLRNVTVDKVRSEDDDLYDLIGEVCAVRVTHKEWTGMRWDKTYRLLPYEAEY